MDQNLCAGKDQLLNQSYNMKMRELLAIAIYNILMYTRSNPTNTAIPSLLKRTSQKQLPQFSSIKQTTVLLGHKIVRTLNPEIGHYLKQLPY